MFNSDYLNDKHFGDYGGRYVPEMLIPALEELEKIYFSLKTQSAFQKELAALNQHYTGRPSPLYYAKNLSEYLGGAKIYLKNEGLNHTGAHKINNVLGQILLAKKMGKKNIVVETGAGQHGLASAAVAAKFGFKCKVFMGEIDIKRQYPNVYGMQLMGAEVISVKEGTRTLKDSVNAAFKYWIENLNDCHYLLGSALGPYPYPLIVRDFQSIIGTEVKEQILQLENRLPDQIIACVGGGSNALGIFYPFLAEEKVELVGIEAGGYGKERGEHASRFLPNSASIGIVQGYKSYFIQNQDGQLAKTHSISAGLDYAGISPELAHLKDSQKVRFENASDQNALAAFKLLAKKEGIFAALESAHAIAGCIKIAPTLSKDKIIVANLSGRGDKDLFITAKKLQPNEWQKFLQQEITAEN